MTTVYVDAMNVLGSRPDRWWLDRDAAVRRLADELQSWAATSDRAVHLVVDGHPQDALPEGAYGHLEVHFATRAGRDAADDRIVELVRADQADDIEVVTADRELRDRVTALGATVRGPRTLLDEAARLRG